MLAEETVQAARALRVRVRHYARETAILRAGAPTEWMGMVLRGGATVESNLFNFNRHSIAGVGYGDSWYIARYNVDMGDVLDHVYDMHGGQDRGDGTNIAGKFVEMYNNTFLTDDRPYHVRGVPVEKQTFYHNILFHPVSQYNLNVLRGVRTTISDNIFGIGTENVVK